MWALATIIARVSGTRTGGHTAGRHGLAEAAHDDVHAAAGPPESAGEPRA